MKIIQVQHTTCNYLEITHWVLIRHPKMAFHTLLNTFITSTTLLKDITDFTLPFLVTPSTLCNNSHAAFFPRWSHTTREEFGTSCLETAKNNLYERDKPYKHNQNLYLNL